MTDLASQNAALREALAPIWERIEAACIGDSTTGPHSDFIFVQASEVDRLQRALAAVPPASEGEDTWGWATSGDTSVEDCYVAWCRYTGRSIVTCDSDALDAFKVYRHPTTILQGILEESVEEYIRQLRWSGLEKAVERTLVAGNIRGFAAALRAAMEKEKRG